MSVGVGAVIVLSFLAFGFWSLAGILTALAQHSLPPGGAVACVGTDTLTSV